jgi:hypothetical protein
LTEKLSPQEWRDRAQEYATEVGCPDDLWDADDPYELGTVALSDYTAGRTPEEFVRYIFADDLAEKEADEQSFTDSLSGDVDE